MAESDYGKWLGDYQEDGKDIPQGHITHPDGCVLPGPGALRTKEGRRKFDAVLKEAGIDDENSPLHFTSSE